MSRQGTAVIRLLFLIIVATLLVSVGGGAFAQDTDIKDGAGESVTIPTPAGEATQDGWGDSKPPLIGGVPSEPPPFVNPSSPSRGQAGTDFQSSPDAPTITIWPESTQKTGLNGDPQKWVNIVGTVTPKPATLTYSLNNGPHSNLRIGPDSRRLAMAGDFVIELDYTDLNQGLNQIRIIARDGQGVESQATVTVDYQGGNVTWSFPQTYDFDWSTVSRIDDLARVVDGDWELDGDVVRPVVLAYDRLIALGDLSWRDYTVTVPITFTGIDEDGYQFPSNGPGVGIIVRWQGHINDGKTAPLEGWRRLGAYSLYSWNRNLVDDELVYTEGLRMFRYQGNPNQVINVARKLEMDTTYNFKISVQSTGNPNPPSNYKFKVWEAGSPEPDWDIEVPGLVGEPASGGILLVAHHVDAEFGKVTVALDSTLPPPTLTVNTTGNGSGDVEVFPSRQNNTYRFGEDVRLTAIPDSGSDFASWQGGVTGNTNPVWLEMFSNRSVTAVFADESIGAPVSDDFSACVLNPRWDYIDPLGNSTLSMNGSRIQISVPSGTRHDIWTNNRNAPRVMQNISNEDFELDVKFDSPMSSMYQFQGILIDQDNTNFLRYAFQHDGSTYRITAHSVSNNTATLRVNDPVTISVPMYLRANRAGNTWTLSYSGDGQNWTQATQFNFSLEASSAGVFAGNAGQNPSMISQVDYFFNTASPIVPQDNGRKITVTTAGSGSGTVTQTPQKVSYACNEAVTLEAIPASGSHFTGWSDDLSGADNPVTINVMSDMFITATFTEDDVYHTLEITTQGQGTVGVTPPGSQFLAGTQVSLLATPAAGHRFVRWEGAVTGNSNPATLIMDGNKSVNAVFEPDDAPPTESLIFLPTVLTD